MPPQSIINPLRIKNIVIAEDSEFDAEFTIKTLNEIPLANPLLHLWDGEAVIDYLYSTGPYKGQRNPEPTLLILDIHMPKVSGIEILRRIKSDRNKQHIPVIMLVCSNDMKETIESYGLGVNSYLTKPIDLNEFEKAICTLEMNWAIISNKPARKIKNKL